jgi:hypothetical protein
MLIVIIGRCVTQVRVKVRALLRSGKSGLSNHGFTQRIRQLEGVTSTSISHSLADITLSSLPHQTPYNDYQTHNNPPNSESNAVSHGITKLEGRTGLKRCIWRCSYPFIVLEHNSHKLSRCILVDGSMMDRPPPQLKKLSILTPAMKRQPENNYLTTN